MMKIQSTMKKQYNTDVIIEKSNENIKNDVNKLTDGLGS